MIHRGQFFTFEVLDESGNTLDIESLKAAFNNIIEQEKTFNNVSIGILTTENRDVWADQ